MGYSGFLKLAHGLMNDDGFGIEVDRLGVLVAFDVDDLLFVIAALAGLTVYFYVSPNGDFEKVKAASTEDEE